MQNPLIIVIALAVAALAGLLIFANPFGESTPVGTDQGQQNPQVTTAELANAPAVINGEPISEAEIDFITQANIELFRQLYGQLGVTYEDELLGTTGEYKMLQHRGDALNDLVQGKLQDQAVAERDIQADAESIQVRFLEEFDGLLLSFGVSEADLIQFLDDPANREIFRQVLFQSGIMQLEHGDYAEFRLTIRENAARDLARESLKASIVGDLNPTIQDLLDFIDENRDQYMHQAVPSVLATEQELISHFDSNRELYPNASSFEDVIEEIRSRVETEKQEVVFEDWLQDARQSNAIPSSVEVLASHILITVSPDDSPEVIAEARAEIEAIRERIMNGESFAGVANEVSEDPGTQGTQNGGQLGWFGLGRMVASFEAAVFALDINEISPIIQTQYGFHIAQVTDRRETGNFEEIIRTQYEQQISDEIFQEWLGEQLEAAELVINDPILYAYSLDQQTETVVAYQSKLQALDDATAAYQAALSQQNDASWLDYVISQLLTEKIDLINARLGSISDRSSSDAIGLERELAQLREDAVNHFLRSDYSTFDDVAFEKMLVYAPENPDLIFEYATFLFEEQYDVIRSVEYLNLLQLDFPSYRVTEVEALLNTISEGEGIGPDGLPGRPIDILNADHIQQGASHPPYNSLPPTSGWHYPVIASYGISTEPIPDEIQIHNLEHGAVIIQYQPDLSAEEVTDMINFVEELRTDQGFCRLILAPYPGLDRPVALTAWGRILKMDVFDRPIALSFAGYFLDQGPEQVDDCQVTGVPSELLN